MTARFYNNGSLQKGNMTALADLAGVIKLIGVLQLQIESLS